MFLFLQNKENLEFINADLDKSVSYLGKFQVVILQNCLEDLQKPIAFLKSLKNIVFDGGFLIISADYNWTNKLDIVSILILIHIIFLS